MNHSIPTIDKSNIQNKKVLLRVDFDVSLNPDLTIADDARIRQNLPTIKYLLKNHNKLICVAKLDRPKGRDPKLSLQVAVDRLKTYLPNYIITLVDDFLTTDKKTFEKQKEKEILVLENIRFYPQEKENDQEFVKKLASLADIYVNDAFAMCHRKEASIIGVPLYIPSFAGLLLKKEIETISETIRHPKKPFVVIVGGAKISTKLPFIQKLTALADYVLLGGGLADNFLKAKGYEIGKSIVEEDELEETKKLLALSNQEKTRIVIPSDVIVEASDNRGNGGEVRKIDQVGKNDVILDIGPQTQANFGTIIARAKTIIWNGPVGYFENQSFRRGTDFIYYSITQNTNVVSIVGGGDTLAAISKKEYLEKITHISTGGGAMLEFIENGTLPGIEALKK